MENTHCKPEASDRGAKFSRRRARRGDAVVLIANALSLASLLGAQDVRATPLELEWTAPSECPKSDFVKAEVEKVVGRPWQQLGQPWQTAQALVTLEDGGGYRLRVTVVTGAGGASERNVLAASCTEAAEAAVAILTAGMAPGDAQTPKAASGPASRAPGATSGSQWGTEDEARPSPERAQSAASTEGLTQSDESAATSSAGRDARVPIRPLLGARFGVDFGTLAAAAPFAQVTAGFELGRFVLLGSFGITGKVLEEVRGSGAGAQMSLLMGSLAGCWQIIGSNPVLRGCGGVELGSLEASGFGTAESRSGRAFWSAGVAEGVLDWHITDASFASLGVSAIVPFRQLHVSRAPADLHQTSALAARPWLGLGVRFR